MIIFRNLKGSGIHIDKKYSGGAAGGDLSVEETNSPPPYPRSAQTLNPFYTPSSTFPDDVTRDSTSSSGVFTPNPPEDEEEHDYDANDPLDRARHMGMDQYHRTRLIPKTPTRAPPPTRHQIPRRPQRMMSGRPQRMMLGQPQRRLRPQQNMGTESMRDEGTLEARRQDSISENYPYAYQDQEEAEVSPAYAEESPDQEVYDPSPYQEEEGVADVQGDNAYEYADANADVQHQPESDTEYQDAVEPAETPEMFDGGSDGGADDTAAAGDDADDDGDNSSESRSQTSISSGSDHIPEDMRMASFYEMDPKEKDADDFLSQRERESEEMIDRLKQTTPTQ